jgi:hypothetical protein
LYFVFSIRAIDLTTSKVTTIAGSSTCGYVDGAALGAQLYHPVSLYYYVAANTDKFIYFTDMDNHCVRYYAFASKFFFLTGVLHEKMTGGTYKIEVHLYSTRTIVMCICKVVAEAVAE